MRKRILFSLVILLFFGLGVQAQSTFEDKKHSDNKSSKAAQDLKFDFSKLKVKPKASAAKSTKSAFQKPSVFNLKAKPALYNHKVLKYSKTGLPIFIQSIATEETAKSVKNKSVEKLSTDYLIDVKHLLQINNAKEEFKTISQRTDDLGLTHIKMQQVFKGVKVYGSEIVLHLNKKRQTHILNGRSRPTPVLENVVPKISVAKAITQIEHDLGVTLPKSDANKSGLNKILKLSEHQQELLIYNIDGNDVLTRHITVFPSIMDRWEYFIDANTGQVLDKYYHTCVFHFDFKEEKSTHSNSIMPPNNGSGSDLNGVNRQLNTWSDGSINFLLNTTKPMFNAGQSQLPDNPVGGILTLDLRNEAPGEGAQIFHVTSNSTTWNNATAVSAHYNADISYEYFKNTFNRNSINGQGGTIISFINVGDESGGSLENAFWNGNAMFYGNGGTAFSALAGALDVGGHEMSHGVIQNTANLEYRNQSGAINESYADIFGAMIDRDDWKLAEDIVNTQQFPSGAMRDMQNPNNGGSGLGQNGWQPKDMTEFYSGTQDNGGVHINSGIPNRAYYLFATAIGKDKAEQVYYRALDNYLTVSSRFIDLRLAVIQAATDLHGSGATEVQAAESAFDTVGITNGEATDTDNDIPAASGDDFILSLDIDSNNPNTLYISNTSGEDFVPLTTTSILRKPSVADDGSFAIFVTGSNTINAVTLNENNIEENIISSEQIWAAVALSKDGAKLAAVQNNQENIIYVFDLINNTNNSFELYNPTSAEGITTGEVLYPDALEWDYSGQYLIYDALNRIDNGDGQDIDYWDVGVLNVWNNQTNAFADGSIQKLFTNLPEGVSIGNPSFSKTSGNILAFDYFDGLNGIYEVIAADVEQGNVMTVYQNNKLGYPNYSKTDEQLIFDSNNNGDDDIMVINMAADKISSSGNASELIPDGKWGIWYTVGERESINDDDNDGVVNDLDQCSNTPANTTVDINGCEIFALPVDNFRVLAKGESCRNSNNGSIEITASENRNYTVTVTGNGVNASGDFTTSGFIDNLEGGTYTVCITVQGQAGYENCFDVVVAEPEALSVSSKTNLTARTVTLNLSGGSLYTINLNDAIFTTSQNKITLPLVTEATNLIVRTDKDCQGVYEEHIDLSARVIVYPNPVSGDAISVQLGKISLTPIRIRLNAFDGRLILKKTAEAGTRIVEINADVLSEGMYLLSVQIDGETETYKIIKR